MSEVSSNPLPFDASIVACPVCHGDLRLEADRLICAGCGRAYPIVDGIPVLIADRAKLQQNL
jgi:uncharacterized protein YbaR (Trm112 family)